MDISKLSLLEIVEKLRQREVTSEELVKYYIDRIEEYKDYNAVLEVFEDALDRAREMDEKIKQGFEGKLAGVPVIIKDNILYKGKKATCASRFLEDYVAQYSSTVVEKLIESGAVIIGRANMDEFAMGGSNENSAYGVCHNALDFDRVAGGSSGGSAVSVAKSLCACALGTDTGGSVRQPSSFNGLVGMKPTYGRVSRYGIVAFASSLDQVGPITKTVKDNAYLLSVISGYSKYDETSKKEEVEDYLSKIDGDIKDLKIGVCSEVKELVKGLPVEKTYFDLIERLKSQGNEIVEVSIKDLSLVMACYYIIAPAEATSNLGRFDGVKYSRREKGCQDIDEIYIKSRTSGFGKEVKRRIMLGNFVLSSGYFDAYYNKAKKVQQRLKKQTLDALASCDVLLLPTTCGEAFKIGEKIEDPISMYKEDIFTTLANITGLPALTLPCGKGENGMPLGMQFVGKEFEESKLYNLADYIERRRSEWNMI
ncbi:MAG: Asp-tRNA(Asn)/Glu-tRNA(Gln) amidotransferase subunit GatA [Clostridia bacterium]|nr:Asp-tRNA(Asn)/Glu-tRNA(Gln) amidotransferase subunit GatA [Clostridia bacterium]